MTAGSCCAVRALAVTQGRSQRARAGGCRDHLVDGRCMAINATPYMHHVDVLLLFQARYGIALSAQRCRLSGALPAFRPAYVPDSFICPDGNLHDSCACTVGGHGLRIAGGVSEGRGDMSSIPAARSTVGSGRCLCLCPVIGVPCRGRGAFARFPCGRSRRFRSAGPPIAHPRVGVVAGGYERHRLRGEHHPMPLSAGLLHSGDY